MGGLKASDEYEESEQLQNASELPGALNRAQSKSPPSSRWTLKAAKATRTATIADRLNAVMALNNLGNKTAGVSLRHPVLMIEGFRRSGSEIIKSG